MSKQDLIKKSKNFESEELTVTDLERVSGGDAYSTTYKCSNCGRTVSEGYVIHCGLTCSCGGRFQEV